MAEARNKIIVFDFDGGIHSYVNQEKILTEFEDITGFTIENFIKLYLAGVIKIEPTGSLEKDKLFEIIKNGRLDNFLMLHVQRKMEEQKLLMINIDFRKDDNK